MRELDVTQISDNHNNVFDFNRLIKFYVIATRTEAIAKTIAQKMSKLMEHPLMVSSLRLGTLRLKEK